MGRQGNGGFRGNEPVTLDAGSSYIPEGETDQRAARIEKGAESNSALPRVLRCLFEEHRHLNALMRALERKTRQNGSLKVGDYCLLRDIVWYLHDYPDRVHHPTENLLFEKMLQRDPSRKKTVTGLRRDHKAVAVETRGLLDLLDKAIDKPGKKVEQSVRRDCLDFVEHQREHMQFENQKLFPAAIETLSEVDWKQIETHFAAVEDPLFGRVVGNSHRPLYEYLVDLSGKTTESFSISRLFSLERLILTVELLEKNSLSSCARLNVLGQAVSEETRAAVAASLKPEGLVSAIGLPVKYAAFLGRSMLDCSGDLARISSATAKDTLALYTGRNPIK